MFTQYFYHMKLHISLWWRAFCTSIPLINKFSHIAAPSFYAGWRKWIGSFGLINQFGNWCLNHYTVNWAPWLLPVIVQSTQIHCTSLLQFWRELEQERFSIVLLDHISKYLENITKWKGFFYLFLCTSQKIADILEKSNKNNDIMLSAPFLPGYVRFSSA